MIKITDYIDQVKGANGYRAFIPSLLPSQLMFHQFFKNLKNLGKGHGFVSAGCASGKGNWA